MRKLCYYSDCVTRSRACANKSWISIKIIISIRTKTWIGNTNRTSSSISICSKSCGAGLLKNKSRLWSFCTFKLVWNNNSYLVNFSSSDLVSSILLRNVGSDAPVPLIAPIVFPVGLTLMYQLPTTESHCTG